MIINIALFFLVKEDLFEEMAFRVHYARKQEILEKPIYNDTTSTSNISFVTDHRGNCRPWKFTDEEMKEIEQFPVEVRKEVHNFRQLINFMGELDGHIFWNFVVFSIIIPQVCKNSLEEVQ